MSKDSTKVKKSSTLGVYLKNRNYTKSDFVLSHTSKQFVFNKMIEEDITRANSFLYSNVLCLSNHHHAVEQHFGKFVQFVQNQEESIKNELSNLFGPIICHIYIELLKGREWKPAYDFLRKHAYLVAPIENLSAPLPSKINGCSVQSSSFHNDPTTASSYPTVTTQILYTNESTGNPIRDHFKEIICTLSTCLKIESLENKESVVLLRSSKYDIEMNLISIDALKKYLEEQGHVIILNILRTWIHFTIRDFKSSGSDDDNENNEDNNSCFILDEEIKKESLDLMDNKKSDDDDERTETKTSNNSINSINEEKKSSTNMYLKKLVNVVEKINKTDIPLKTIKIFDSEKNISNASIDSKHCHLVAAYQDSTIKLWQLNRSICLGKNLYERIHDRTCDWAITSETEGENDNSDEERKRSLAFKTQEFYSKKFEGNSFDDSGGIILRGHTRGVTDCIFSNHFPLLFTTSKDCTMRVWKSDNYSCGAIYRGHNYPVWCVSESPIGTYLATGSRDFSARLWTIDREFPLMTYVGHSQDVDCIAFHPNGNYLATGSCDLSVRLWSVTSGKLFRVFTECRYPIISISFSPDGKYLAAGGEENKVRIFDLAAGSQINELKDHTSPVNHIIWNSSSNKIASCCLDGSVQIWDITKLHNTDQQASSSSSFTAHRILQYNSSCSRGIKVFFNSNDTITLIGSINNVAKNTAVSDTNSENFS